jgi:hypothetical protein
MQTIRSMPSLEPDDSAKNEAWEKAREEDEADTCSAGLVHDHDEAACPRGSQCRCARPIGHPTAVTVQRPRSAVTERR